MKLGIRVKGVICHGKDRSARKHCLRQMTAAKALLVSRWLHDSDSLTLRALGSAIFTIPAAGWLWSQGPKTSEPHITPTEPGKKHADDSAPEDSEAKDGEENTPADEEPKDEAKEEQPKEEGGEDKGYADKES